MQKIYYIIGGLILGLLVAFLIFGGLLSINKTGNAKTVISNTVNSEPITDEVIKVLWHKKCVNYTTCAVGVNCSESSPCSTGEVCIKGEVSCNTTSSN